MKRAVRFKRFSSRIRAVVVIVTAVTLLIYNIVCYTSAGKILKEDFFSRSDSIMEKNNERLEEYMDEFSVNMGLVAENDILCDSLESGIYDGNVLLLIQNLTAMDRYTDNVEIYSKDLKISYKANDNLSGITQSDADKLFCDFNNTDRMYKTLFLKNGTDDYKLTVSRSIFRGGNCLGYILVYVDHTKIMENFDSARNFVNSEDVYILDSEKRIVSVESGKLLDAEYSTEKNKLEIKNTIFKQREIYEARVENLDMSVITFVAPTYVLKQLNRLVYQNIFISIIIFVLCILGAVSLGKSISEPIKEIKQYIEENISE